MLDPQTRQQLQTKFQQVKPQLKQRFSGVTDQDLDAWRNDPEQADHDDQPEDGSADVPRRTGDPPGGGLRLVRPPARPRASGPRPRGGERLTLA